MEINESEFSYYEGDARLSPVPLSVNSPVIKPIDKGTLRADALVNMHLQAQQQILLLKKQAEVIMQQVKEIEDRLKISEFIYSAQMGFKPVIGQQYYLYQNDEGNFVMSMIGPNEWGRSKNYFTFVASILLLADGTWQIIHQVVEDLAKLTNHKI